MLIFSDTQALMIAAQVARDVPTATLDQIASTIDFVDSMIESTESQDEYVTLDECVRCVTENLHDRMHNDAEDAREATYVDLVTA